MMLIVVVLYEYNSGQCFFYSGRSYAEKVCGAMAGRTSSFMGPTGVSSAQGSWDFACAMR